MVTNVIGKRRNFISDTISHIFGVTYLTHCKKTIAILPVLCIRYDHEMNWFVNAIKFPNV